MARRPGLLFTRRCEAIPAVMCFGVHSGNSLPYFRQLRGQTESFDSGLEDILFFTIPT